MTNTNIYASRIAQIKANLIKNIEDRDLTNQVWGNVPTQEELQQDDSAIDELCAMIENREV